MVLLGDLVDITGGGTPRRKVAEYWNGEIPWASVKDFKSAELKTVIENITEEGLKRSASNLIPAGTIIVPTRMAVGKAAINMIDMAINQDLKALIIKDKKKVDRDYLFRSIINKSGYLERRGKGATVKGITLDVLKEMAIPLPPLKEQKRIAAILDKADGIRRKRQQAIDLTDQLLRSVFLDMFGDPVTNPKGWGTKPLTFYADVITGFAFKSRQFIGNSDESVRLCRGANVLTGYLNWGDTKYWSTDELDDLEEYKVQQSDILLAMDRPWISSGLKICLYHDDGKPTYLVQRVARIRSKNTAFNEFVFASISNQSFERHCKPTETTVPHISPVELKKYELFDIPLVEIERFEKAASKMRSNIKKFKCISDQYNELFNALTQQAFNGNLSKQAKAA